MIDTAPLIAEITAAFDGVAREDGVSLREGRAIDACVSDKKRSAARRLDTDTRWQDVPNADLLDYYNSLVYLDAKGFRYYLPAYLIWDLTANISSHGIDSNVLFHLQVPPQPNLRHDWLERFSSLTPQQGKAVCRFLRFVAVYGTLDDPQDAAAALADYWSRYCEGDAE